VNVADLLSRVRHHGWDVRLDGGNPRFVRVQPDAGKLPLPLVDAFRKHRDAVVKWLSECVVCGADVSDDETRDRMQDALFCGNGGGDAVRDMDGVLREGCRRCPYKATAT
jgi:hypothetical protein